MRKDMEWELRALIKQLECLLEEPDLITDEDQTQMNDLCVRADSLNSRTGIEMEIEQVELICKLLCEMNNLVRDYHLVIFVKRRRHWENVAATHWEPGQRLRASRMCREISLKISEMAQRTFQSGCFAIVKE